MEKTPNQIKGKSLIKLEKPLEANSEKAFIDISKNNQKDLKDKNIEEEMILLNLKPKKNYSIDKSIDNDLDNNNY
jgi:hypothetical protein